MIHSPHAPIHSKMVVPGSWNIAARALFLAALSDGASELIEIPLNPPMMTFLHVLQGVGIVIQVDHEARSCIVGGGSGQFPKKNALIACENSMMVLQMMLAGCATSVGEYQFEGSELLQKNEKIRFYLEIMQSQGAIIHSETNLGMPFVITGDTGIMGGMIELDTTETALLASALLMVAPFAKKNLQIKLDDSISSFDSEMTCKMMADFGVLVKRMRNGRYLVPIPQRYHAREYVIEPDFMMASAFFAAAAITSGEVTIQKLDIQHAKQSEIAFLKVLEKIGCHVEDSKNGLTIRGSSELKGVSVDMRYYPNIVPILSAIAPFTKTPTTMTNIGQLRHKELDLMTVMRVELEKLHIKVEEGPDWLKIYPSIPEPAFIHTHNDYRVALAFAILGLKVPGIKLDNVACVHERYPHFTAIAEVFPHLA